VVPPAPDARLAEKWAGLARTERPIGQALLWLCDLAASSGVPLSAWRRSLTGFRSRPAFLRLWEDRVEAPREGAVAVQPGAAVLYFFDQVGPAVDQQR
jgi:hypothetical protein